MRKPDIDLFGNVTGSNKPAPDLNQGQLFTPSPVDKDGLEKYMREHYRPIEPEGDKP